MIATGRTPAGRVVAATVRVLGLTHQVLRPLPGLRINETVPIQDRPTDVEDPIIPNLTYN